MMKTRTSDRVGLGLARILFAPRSRQIRFDMAAVNRQFVNCCSCAKRQERQRRKQRKLRAIISPLTGLKFVKIAKNRFMVEACYFCPCANYTERAKMENGQCT